MGPPASTSGLSVVVLMKIYLIVVQPVPVLATGSTGVRSYIPHMYYFCETGLTLWNGCRGAQCCTSEQKVHILFTMHMVHQIGSND